MKLVFNRSQNTVVYGDGLMVVPGGWSYVDDEKYPGVGKALDAGHLIEKDVPSSLPANVSDDAAGALKAAIEDQAVEAAEDVPDKQPDKEDRSVRNTGRSRTKTSNTKGA